MEMGGGGGGGVHISTLWISAISSWPTTKPLLLISLLLQTKMFGEHDDDFKLLEHALSWNVLLNVTPGCEIYFDNLWSQSDIRINNFFEWY